MPTRDRLAPGNRKASTAKMRWHSTGASMPQTTPRWSLPADVDAKDVRPMVDGRSAKSRRSLLYP